MNPLIRRKAQTNRDNEYTNHIFQEQLSMYIEFTAYCGENWKMNPETAKKIAELLPNIDSWITYSLQGGEDERGEYMCYCYGEEDFFAEDGLTELHGEELEQAENYNYIDILEAYIALKPLEGQEIIKVWINDGRQRRPTIDSAKKELENISVVLSKN